MNELLFSCSDSLTQATTPDCATDYGERVMQILLSQDPVTAASYVPTATEFNTAYDSGDVTLIKGITKGHRVFVGDTEIEVIHKEWVDPVYRVEGRISRFNESIARMCEELTRYPVLYLYYITETNYCFGPYEANPNFSLILYNGKGSPVGIEFFLEYVGNGIDYAEYDEDYKYLPGEPPEPVTSITADSTIITVDSTIITVDAT